MIKGLNLYTEEEVATIISTIDHLITAQNRGIYQEDVDPRTICDESKRKLKDLKHFIEHGSYSTNFATRNELSYPAT